MSIDLFQDTTILADDFPRFNYTVDDSTQYNLIVLLVALGDKFILLEHFSSKALHFCVGAQKSDAMALG